MRTEPTPVDLAPEDGARRRRPALLAVSAVGVVIALLGGLGVFADAFDRSTTGTNSIESGDYDDPDADLQIAVYDHATGSCGTFSDDLATGLHTVGADDATWNGSRICLRNVGELDGYVSMSIIDPIDEEVGCSPDEGLVDDTCGAPGAGELADLVYVYAGEPSTDTCNAVVNPVSSSVIGLVTTPLALFHLPAGQTVDDLCVAATWGGTPEQMQQAQTDRFTWRYAFDIGPEAQAPVCQDDVYEPDSTFAEARQLDEMGHGSGVICASDQDVFVYQHPGGDLTADLAFDPTFGDLDLILYDAELTPVSSSTNFDTAEQITRTDAAPGTYYVVVRGYDDPEGTPYPNFSNTYDLTVSSSGVEIAPPPGEEPIR